MANYKFAIGQKVSYSVYSKVLFTGTIFAIDTDKANKPYVITGDDGNEYYAHTEFLTAI